MKTPVHIPVLLSAVMELLRPSGKGVYLDATIGGGGHTREILRRIDGDGVVIGMDRDSDALARVEKELKDERLVLLKASFSEMTGGVRGLGYEVLDGILMDLGISMMQLRDDQRGFSFSSGAYLDMRMDRSSPVTAERIVNDYNPMDIERILRDYGEERFARKIARAIVEERKKARIRRCDQLAGIVERVYRRRGRMHPATKTFQALRIAVNEELKELETGLENAVALLREGARLCVITYHSLEDRIVKRYFISLAKEGRVRKLNKKPLRPSADELRENPSSRSAKLRGVERL